MTGHKLSTLAWQRVSRRSLRKFSATSAVKKILNAEGAENIRRDRREEGPLALEDAASLYNTFLDFTSPGTR